MSNKDDWYHDDTFWQHMQPYMFDDSLWDLAPVEVDHLVDRVALSPGAQVLDLPCGPGRHSLLLAERGFDVTAVDLSPTYLESLRDEARKRDIALRMECSDMKDFCRPNSFDMVLNLFTSFGYYANRSDDQLTLQNMHLSLRPGGFLVMEMIAKEWLIRHATPQSWKSFKDGAFLLQERTIEQNWSRIENRWILIKPDGSRHTFQFGHRLFTASELSSELEQAGFKDIGLFGGLTDQPVDPEHPRLVAVARK